MTPYHFSMTVSNDGSCHAFVLHRGVFVASRTFKPGELNELPEWLADSKIWTRDLAAAAAVQPTISYDHHDGMLHVSHALGQDTKYDPNNEEHLARLVRRLKSKAPLPTTPSPEQPTITDLPVPTADELAARTIFNNVGIPKGVEGYRPHKPKARYQQPTASKVRTQEIVNALLDEFGFN